MFGSFHRPQLYAYISPMHAINDILHASLEAVQLTAHNLSQRDFSGFTVIYRPWPLVGRLPHERLFDSHARIPPDETALQTKIRRRYVQAYAPRVHHIIIIIVVVAFRSERACNYIRIIMVLHASNSSSQTHAEESFARHWRRHTAHDDDDETASRGCNRHYHRVRRQNTHIHARGVVRFHTHTHTHGLRHGPDIGNTSALSCTMITHHTRAHNIHNISIVIILL